MIETAYRFAGMDSSQAFAARGRCRRLATMRSVGMWVLYAMGRQTLPQVALTTRRHHTTVMHDLDAVRRAAHASDPRWTPAFTAYSRAVAEVVGE